MRRRLALLLLVGSLLGACKDGGAAATDPTVPTRPSTSSSTTATTEAPDIATIPPVIDEPYLNRVLAALEGVDTDAVQVVVDSSAVPPEAAEIFNSIYSDEWFALKVDSWISALRRDPKLSSLKRPLGDRLTTVERLISVSPTCVFMAVKRDYSQSDVNPHPPRTEYVALEPLDPSNDPKNHNPTAWMITTDGFRKDGAEPGNPCPSA